MTHRTHLLTLFIICAANFSITTHAAERKVTKQPIVRLLVDGEPINYKILRDTYGRLGSWVPKAKMEILEELYQYVWDSSYVLQFEHRTKLRNAGLLDDNDLMHKDTKRSVRSLLYVNAPAGSIQLCDPYKCIMEQAF